MNKINKLQKNNLSPHLIQMVNDLDYDLLRELAHYVNGRFKIIQRVEATYALRHFAILDRVTFIHEDRKYTGTINRINQKSVSVILDNRQQWLVSPQMLTKVAEKNPLEHLLSAEQLEKLRSKRRGV